MKFYVKAVVVWLVLTAVVFVGVGCMFKLKELPFSENNIHARIGSDIPALLNPMGFESLAEENKLGARERGYAYTMVMNDSYEESVADERFKDIKAYFYSFSVIMDKSGNVVRKGVITRVEDSECDSKGSLSCLKDGDTLAFLNITDNVDNDNKAKIANAVERYGDRVRIHIDDCVIENSYCYPRKLTVYDIDVPLYTLENKVSAEFANKEAYPSENVWVHGVSGVTWTDDAKFAKKQNEFAKWAAANHSKLSTVESNSANNPFTIGYYDKVTDGNYIIVTSYKIDMTPLALKMLSIIMPVTFVITLIGAVVIKVRNN